MRLADLRKLSIRKNLKIRFSLSNGMECVITEHGIAEVPGLRRVPDFNLEQELAGASEFVLEPVVIDKKNPPKPQKMAREALTALAVSSPSAAPEHEDE
jgi:hypothetical protein